MILRFACLNQVNWNRHLSWRQLVLREERERETVVCWEGSAVRSHVVLPMNTTMQIGLNLFHRESSDDNEKARDRFFGFSRPHESWKRLSNLIDHTPIRPEMTWERKMAATCCDANLRWKWTHTQNRLQVFSAARVFRKTLQPEKTWNQFVVSEHERDGRHVLWRQPFAHTQPGISILVAAPKCRICFFFRRLLKANNHERQF